MAGLVGPPTTKGPRLLLPMEGGLALQIQFIVLDVFTRGDSEQRPLELRVNAPVLRASKLIDRLRIVAPALPYCERLPFALPPVVFCDGATGDDGPLAQDLHIYTRHPLGEGVENGLVVDGQLAKPFDIAQLLAHRLSEPGLPRPPTPLLSPC